MNTKYTIKNFRVFDEKGVMVDIKPITILTGCNSSGKSSIVKSMVLLNTYIDSLQEDYQAFNRIDLQKHKLDFTKDSTMTLGNFDRVIHSGSKEKTITFQYQVHSLLLGEDVEVSMIFGTDENDSLKNGYLLEIIIMNPSGETIYSSSGEPLFQANYNLILHNFFRFVKGQFFVDAQREYKSKHHGLYGLQTIEEFHKTIKELPSDWREKEEREEKDLINLKEAIDWYYSSFVSIYGKDALLDIQDWEKLYGKDYDSLALGFSQDKKSIMDKWANGNIDIVDVSMHWNTLFYFPLLEKLYYLDKVSFKDALLSMLVGATVEKEVSYAIDKIFDDFANSDSSTFGEYFKKKESDFLMFQSDSHEKGLPYIDGTKFLKIEDSNIYENYLNWTKRMFGSGFVETPTGNLSSTIGIGEYDEWKDYPVSFSMLYSVLMNINIMIDSSESGFYYKKDSSINTQYPDFQHRVFGMFVDYASMVMREVVTSAIPQDLSYIGTSLVNVRRDYSLDSNDSFTNLIKRYLAAQRAYKNSRYNDALGKEIFISKWVKKLGLGYSVSIEVSNSGSSFVVRLYKTENDKIGSILAEEGYGVTQIVTLLIRIETAILESKKNVEFDDYEKPIYSFSESTIAIEEPEVHLHPKFQSLLAEMFVDAYTNYNVHFIIETHSEYLIRKLQTMVANKAICNSNISIIYVYDSDISKRPLYTPQVKEIDIAEDGRLQDSFGNGFFDEADNLVMNLLNQKIQKDESNS